MENREIRLRNLEALIASMGTAKAVAERCGLNAHYLYQLRSPRTKASVGSDVARRLEAGMGKPRGWMDIPHDHIRTDVKRSVHVGKTPVHLVKWADLQTWLEGSEGGELMAYAEEAGVASFAPPNLDNKNVLAVEGDGETVLIDTSQAPQHEHRAVVYMHDVGLVLGVYTKRGKQQYITDPHLGPIELVDGNHRTVGRVVGAYRPE